MQSTPLRSVAGATDLSLAGQFFECHVLSDGRRVLDTSQVQAFLGASKNRMFRRMLARIPGLSEEIQAHPSAAFLRPDGRSTAYGYEASFVMDVCLAYQRAFLAGKLHAKQMHLARCAMEIVAAAAKVGLDAMIDEVTGHKKRRPDEYQSRFDRYLREVRETWHERWTPSIVRTFCRLYRIRYDGSRFPPLLFGIAGHIYDKVIGEDVMAELRRRNPAPSKGRNHHLFFEEEVQRHLERELIAIQALAEGSHSRGRFWEKMRSRYDGDALQCDLWD